MTLIAAVLGLLAARLTDRLVDRETSLATRWVRMLRGIVRGNAAWVEWPVVFLVIVPPVALVAWLQTRLAYPFGWLLQSILVLWLCLGPRDLASDLRRLVAARERGDTEGELRVLRRLHRSPDPSVPGPGTLVGAMFVQSHERTFGVLLWFFAFGPAGALFYRLLSQLPIVLYDEQRGETPGEQFAETLHGLAAWIPVRVTALLYGLAGSLDDALAAWRRLGIQPQAGWRHRNWALLGEIGGGSLQSEGEDGAPVVPASLDALMHEVLAMQFRSLLICLAFFAFFATGGWLQ